MLKVDSGNRNIFIWWMHTFFMAVTQWWDRGICDRRFRLCRRGPIKRHQGTWQSWLIPTSNYRNLCMCQQTFFWDYGMTNRGLKTSHKMFQSQTHGKLFKFFGKLQSIWGCGETQGAQEVQKTTLGKYFTINKILANSEIRTSGSREGTKWQKKSQVKLLGYIC